ncbi:riboflavin kinase [Candidatus Saccharibacteria bacterium]|nr:riboflavin kinase [Candidatus Saccharibacteria bacterium]
MNESRTHRTNNAAPPRSWRSGTVLRGDQYGRVLGFPTANLDATILKTIKKEGVYACNVRLGGNIYRGALYLGPRIVLRETQRVLEIHILDFDQEIYGKILNFKLGVFIRPPEDFDSIADLKIQLAKDIAAARAARGARRSGSKHAG